MGHSQPLFLYFCLFYVNVQLINKILRMLGFEPQISGVRSDRSNNWATTTATTLIMLSKTFKVKRNDSKIASMTKQNWKRSVIEKFVRLTFQKWLSLRNDFRYCLKKSRHLFLMSKKILCLCSFLPSVHRPLLLPGAANLTNKNLRKKT